jgi:hypothetical protein
VEDRDDVVRRLGRLDAGETELANALASLPPERLTRLASVAARANGEVQRKNGKSGSSVASPDPIVVARPSTFTD